MKNRVAYFGVFVALALIFSYVETMIPFQIGIPGVKLGLANLIVVIALYKTDVKEALLLSVTRVVLSGFIFGNLASILYSLAGGLLSLAVMALLKKYVDLSIIGVSVAGGVFHNIGQLVVAAIVVETYSVTGYLPVLLVAGLITGFVIGTVATEMIRRLRNIDLRLKSIWNRRGTDGMIAYIKGELVILEEDRVIVDVGGVGYGIYMPGRAMSALPPIGSEVLIHTYLNVKEDAMQLYGFLTRDDLAVFRKVITVSGIGPRGGLSILSQLSADDLRFAVMSGDAKAISAAQGIGKKTAEKLNSGIKRQTQHAGSGSLCGFRRYICCIGCDRWNPAGCGIGTGGTWLWQYRSFEGSTSGRTYRRHECRRCAETGFEIYDVLVAEGYHGKKNYHNRESGRRSENREPSQTADTG